MPGVRWGYLDQRRKIWVIGIITLVSLLLGLIYFIATSPSEETSSKQITIRLGEYLEGHNRQYYYSKYASVPEITMIMMINEGATVVINVPIYEIIYLYIDGEYPEPFRVISANYERIILEAA